MICIYHKADLDGICSGAVVKRKYPDAKMIGWDYGEEVPWREFVGEKEIVLIDITFPMKDLVDMAVNATVTIIDHHIGFRKEWDSLDQILVPPINYIYEAGIAACEIGWKYFFPDEPLPKGIEYLSKYDTWRENGQESWNKEILPYQYGIRLTCNSIDTFPENNVFEGGLGTALDIIEKGKEIIKFQKVQNENLCANFAFPMTFKGLRAICLNQGRSSSVSFESIWDEDKYDIMMPFVYNGKFWKWSLYTTKDIDCSVLAKTMGGGGHKQASGFETKTFEEAFI